jgi:putative transposase
MIRAHKIRLKQANCLAHAARTSRFVFNRGPGQWKRQYEAGATLSAPTLKKQSGALRAQAHLWTCEVTKCAVGGAFMDLGKAFKHFFDGRRIENQKPLRVSLRLTVITRPVSFNLEQEACLLNSPR